MAVQDHPELKGLFDADQSDRAGKVDWGKVIPRDAQRRARVRALLGSGAVRTANDYLHAAYVFQHGNTVDDIRTANALATLAMTMQPDNTGNRWIVAASCDRLLMYSQQPQWYGTQYADDARGMYLYPVAEEAVSDAERVRMTGHTLAQARQHQQKAAAKSGPKLRALAPTIEQLRAEAKAAAAAPDKTR